MTDEHRVVAVTPAGRRHYLEILGSYIIKDDSICEWQLWDNCRKPSDRAYIEDLAQRHEKIKIVRAASIDGSNRSINQFYRGLTGSDCFYIKLDDDVVYLPPNFGRRLYKAAASEYGRYTYWSPLVINNALCSWLIKHHSRMHIAANLIAAASCATGWRNPYFAEQLHRAFITCRDTDQLACFEVPNFDISLARFSINCIGFFGSNVRDLGEQFCPLDADDEEWISAVLPSKTGKPGRIIGNLTVAHFAFFTQEIELLKCGVLDEYSRIAGVAPVSYSKRHANIANALRRTLELQVLKRYPRCLPITSQSDSSIAAAPFENRTARAQPPGNVRAGSLP